jgi:hypothetical protein
MPDFQIRDSDIRAGYAFPRGLGLPRSGVSASQRGNEAQDYRGEMNVPGLRTVVPNHREHYWQERGGGVVIPLRGTPEGGGVGNIINKGNNKITELRTILQRESQNS